MQIFTITLYVISCRIGPTSIRRRRGRLVMPAASTLVFILVVVFAVTTCSSRASPFNTRNYRLEARSNDKYPSTFWSNGSKKSSPITYVSSLPFSNWFSKEADEQHMVAEERSHHSKPISNSIADDFLGKYLLTYHISTYLHIG